MSKVLSAVAWPYANGPRHIGHVAGFGVPSDVFSRYMRMAGHDVLMVSGSDEHGTPILIAADEAGVSPQQLADTNHRFIVEDFVSLGLAYDLYTRTTTRNHHAVVQQLFRGVHDNGYFVDGIRVPLLFHIGVGQGVIHPGLIDRVDFFPGAAPASHGGVAGAIIEGQTKEPAAARHGERHAGAGGAQLQPGDQGRQPAVHLGWHGCDAGQ